MADIIALREDQIKKALKELYEDIKDGTINKACIVYVETESDDTGITVLCGGPPDRSLVGLLSEAKTICKSWYWGNDESIEIS